MHLSNAKLNHTRQDVFVGVRETQCARLRRVYTCGVFLWFSCVIGFGTCFLFSQKMLRRANCKSIYVVVVAICGTRRKGCGYVEFPAAYFGRSGSCALVSVQQLVLYIIK